MPNTLEATEQGSDTASQPTPQPALGPKRIASRKRGKKLSSRAAKNVRQYAKGLLAQGRREDALRYLQERRVGLPELPETHAFRMPRTRRIMLTNTLVSPLTMSPTPPPGSPTDAIGGEGVASGGLIVNGNTSVPPVRFFESVKTPVYDPSREPSFEDRPEGSFERGEAVPPESPVTPASAIRTWVEESGIEELSGFLEKPRVVQTPEWVVMPPEDGKPLESQGNPIPEPASGEYPQECVLTILGECRNERLVRVLVPDGREVAMWSWGRHWPEGSTVKGKLESPTGTIVYEPVVD